MSTAVPDPNNSALPPLPPVAQEPVEWHYTRNGQQTGPVTWTQLRQLASSGQLLANDMVWRAGLPAWTVASTIQNLFAPPLLPPGLPVTERPVDSSTIGKDATQTNKENGMRRFNEFVERHPFTSAVVGLVGGAILLVCFCVVISRIDRNKQQEQKKPAVQAKQPEEDGKQPKAKATQPEEAKYLQAWKHLLNHWEIFDRRLNEVDGNKKWQDEAKRLGNDFHATLFTRQPGNAENGFAERTTLNMNLRNEAERKQALEMLALYERQFKGRFTGYEAIRIENTFTALELQLLQN
jgi:hypothetical protein